MDDSTLFLEQADQLPHAMRIVNAFGALSGLHVQPDKSKILFLNRSVKLRSYEGIEVIPPGGTTRYLGFEIGTGGLENKNWALRIQKIQRRLLTATQVATSVENRVLILNSIVLPSLLFTASVFEIPSWAMIEVNNLYKQFLWAHATTTDKSRHKVNPGLLFTPKLAGGIGLADVSVAVNTQRTKHALLWLTQRSDRYFSAWRQWAYRGLAHAAEHLVSPVQAGRRQPPHMSRSPGREVNQTLGEWLAPTQDQVARVSSWVVAHSASLLERATSWWEGDEFVLSYSSPFPTRRLGVGEMPDEIQRFWSTFNWSANPWIRDYRGGIMTRRAYDRIEDSSLARLSISRTGPAEFAILIPKPPHQPHHHSMRKLRRWATALLLSTPAIPIGSRLDAHHPLRMRHAPPGLLPYTWNYQGAGVIEGSTLESGPNPTRRVQLHQLADGIHWRCTGHFPELADGFTAAERTFRSDSQSTVFVFEAHPLLHRFPWSVPDTTPNECVITCLKRQAFAFHKKMLARRLGAFLDRLETRASTDDWQRAVLSQTPQQAWDHSHGLTDFQVWTGYRIVTRQLNLHHAGRSENDECRKRQGCRGKKETPAHLFWECAYAEALWGKLVSQWTGERPSRQRTQQFFQACASRRVSHVPEHRTAILKDRFQEDREMADHVWKRIWHILATMCLTRLWTDRNEAVYSTLVTDIPGTTQSFWTACVYQLCAIATREHRKEASAIMGAVLLSSIELLERAPDGPPGMSRASQSHPSDKPGLAVWLRIYQRSCT